MTPMHAQETDTLRDICGQRKAGWSRYRSFTTGASASRQPRFETTAQPSPKTRYEVTDEPRTHVQFPPQEQGHHRPCSRAAISGAQRRRSCSRDASSEDALENCAFPIPDVRLYGVLCCPSHTVPGTRLRLVRLLSYHAYALRVLPDRYQITFKEPPSHSIGCREPGGWSQKCRQERRDGVRVVLITANKLLTDTLSTR